MVSLRGRKIQVKIDKNMSDITLKKGNTVKIVSSHNTKLASTESKLVVNLADFNRVIKVNTNIIIDDNKSILNVEKIIKHDNHSHSKTNLFSNIGKYKSMDPHDFSMLSFCRENIMDDMSPTIKSTSKYSEKEYENDINDSKKQSPKDKSLQKPNIMEKDEYFGIIHEIDEYENENYVNLEKINNQTIQQIINATDHDNFKIRKMSSFNSNPIESFKIDIPDELESVCRIQYTCTLNEYSCLFVPNINFAKYGIDLLSQREVRELSELDNLGVEFVILPITNSADIKSIKDILSEDSNIKIIASIPDYLSLQNLDDILQYCYGVVLSRTFQLINKNNLSNINELIARLIKKCNNFGKPIFINLDFTGDFEKEPVLKCKELMNNLIEGYDGFIIEINKFFFEKSIDTKFTESILSMTNNFLLQAEFLYDKKFTNPLAKLKHLKHIYHLNDQTEIILHIILEYVKMVNQCVIVYYGDNLKDLEYLSFLRLKNPILVMSKKIDLLKTCRLYYGIALLEHVITDFSKELLEKKVKDMFGDANIVLYQVKKGSPVISLI